MEKELCCSFTGHRDIDTDEYEAIATALQGMIVSLYKSGVKTFICGGAQGFDTVAAVTVLNCRTLCPDIRLVMAIPCPEQSDRWNEASRVLYRRILSHADEIVTISPAYTRDCMLARNRYMVDRSTVLLAYVKKESGGSAYTLRYARKKGLNIVNLADSL